MFGGSETLVFSSTISSVVLLLIAGSESLVFSYVTDIW
jgi:hypothetical protein